VASEKAKAPAFDLTLGTVSKFEFDDKSYLSCLAGECSKKLGRQTFDKRIVINNIKCFRKK